MTSSADLGNSEKPRCSITVQDSRCKGCAICITFCPKGVLLLEGKRPVLAKPEECSGCALCECICPDFALHVSRREDRASTD